MNILLSFIVLVYVHRAFSAASESASGVYGFRLCANGDKIIPSRSRFVFGMTNKETPPTSTTRKRGEKLSRDEVFAVIASSVARKPLFATESTTNRSLWVRYADDDEKTTAQMIRYFTRNEKFTTETYMEERDQKAPSDFEFSYYNPVPDIYLPRNQSLAHLQCGRPQAPSLYDAHIDATIQAAAAASAGQRTGTDLFAAHLLVRNRLAAAAQVLATAPAIGRLQRRLVRKLQARQLHHSHRMLSVRSLHQIGTLWRLRGNQTAALECFRTALVLQPTNANVLLSVAHVNLHLRRLREAHDMCRLSMWLQRSANRWQQFNTMAAIYGHWYNGHDLALRMQRLAIMEHPRHEWASGMHYDRLQQRISEFVLIKWLIFGIMLRLVYFVLATLLPRLQTIVVGYLDALALQYVNKYMPEVEKMFEGYPEEYERFRRRFQL